MPVSGPKWVCLHFDLLNVNGRLLSFITFSMCVGFYYNLKVNDFIPFSPMLKFVSLFFAVFTVLARTRRVWRKNNQITPSLLKISYSYLEDTVIKKNPCSSPSRTRFVRQWSLLGTIIDLLVTYVISIVEFVFPDLLLYV